MIITVCKGLTPEEASGFDFKGLRGSGATFTPSRIQCSGSFMPLFNMEIETSIHDAYLRVLYVGKDV